MELKNDISIRGTLKSVDQYLNIKLDDITVLEDIKYPHMVRGDHTDGRLKKERAWEKQSLVVARDGAQRVRKTDGRGQFARLHSACLEKDRKMKIWMLMIR